MLVILVRWVRRAFVAAALGALLGVATAPPVTLAYAHPPIGQHACRCEDRAPLEVAP